MRVKSEQQSQFFFCEKDASYIKRKRTEQSTLLLQKGPQEKTKLQPSPYCDCRSSPAGRRSPTALQTTHTSRTPPESSPRTKGRTPTLESCSTSSIAAHQLSDQLILPRHSPSAYRLAYIGAAVAGRRRTNQAAINSCTNRTHGPNATAGAHNGEEERSPEYLIPRARRRLPYPSAVGKTTPHADSIAEGEEAKVPAASDFSAVADHATQVDPAHQHSKDRRKQNTPPWI